MKRIVSTVVLSGSLLFTSAGMAATGIDLAMLAWAAGGLAAFAFGALGVLSARRQTTAAA